MTETKVYPAIVPPPYFKGISGVDPKIVKKRVHELPEIVSVKVRDLFPELTEAIYPTEKGLAAVREATEKALEKVDMSMIKPEHSVNILGAHHGFTLMGGQPYAEVLRTVRDVVERRTGCQNIRLRVGVGLRWREAEEYIRFHKLDEAFGRGKALGIAPVDEGIPIETEIGTFYGIKKAYDADWIIHVHNNDIRELYLHRGVDRAMKPFAMAYARIETRSAYHGTWALRSGNYIARNIYDSPLVQKRFAFSTFLVVSPSGVVGVDADNNMLELSKRLDIHNMKTYGKMFRLLGKIDKAIAVFDQATPSSYSFASGIIFCNFFNAHVDLFDLDIPAGTHLGYYAPIAKRQGIWTGYNPAIKAWVINYMWGGLPSSELAETYPTIVVSREQADFLKADTQNLFFMNHAVETENLETAMEFAHKIAGTDNVLVFDGTFGGLNVTKSLADVLFEKAPLASKEVDEQLLPKWMKQRGFE